MSTFVTTVFTSVQAYIYSDGATYWLYMDFLLDSNYSMMDMLVVHIQIFYYTCNILLLLTKQKLEFICDVKNMVILNKWWCTLIG